MASEIDICNAALSLLGDNATVASINPPEGSAQAAHCKRFYPMARDQLVQMHPWNFATKKAAGSLITSTNSAWQYSYAKPNNALFVFAVLPPGALDDYSQPIPGATRVDNTGAIYTPFPYMPMYQTMPFAMELNDADTEVIFTNQEGAYIRYIQRTTDAGRFPPLFVTALSRLLAHFLAGPVIKGDVGMKVGVEMLKLATQQFAIAAANDCRQRQVNPVHNVPWITGR